MKIHRSEDPGEAEAARRAISESDLSFASQALLFWILQHAPEWDISAEKVWKMRKAKKKGHQGEGRSGTIRMFRELESAGYLRRVPSRYPTGGFRTLIEVSDKPEFDPDNWAPEQHGTVPDDPERVVYLVRVPGTTIVKIGTTGNFTQRMAALRSRNGESQIEALWRYRGDTELEAFLHHDLRDIALGGEWFDFEGRDPVAEVTELTDGFYEGSSEPAASGVLDPPYKPPPLKPPWSFQRHEKVDGVWQWVWYAPDGTPLDGAGR